MATSEADSLESDEYCENGLGAQASQNGARITLKAGQVPKSNGEPPPCWQSTTKGDRFAKDV